MADPGHRRCTPSSAPRPRSGAPSGGRASGLAHGFLFADLRGYTRYVERHGDAAGARLLDRYRSLVRRVVAAADGAEIRTEGDSFYVVFDAASAAVRCGLAIIAAAAEASADTGDPIDVGVGIHAGEAVETAEGFVGSAVNLAARLCSTAGSGEVVVSETVRGLSRGSLEVTFEPLGIRRLKGVEEPVAIFRVHPAGARGRSGSPGAHRPWLPATVGGVALVAFALVGVALWQGALPLPSDTPGPAPSAPSTTATGGASPTPNNAGTTLTAAEAALLTRIPLEFQPFCHRSNVEDGAAGGIASLRCDLRGSPGNGADTVWYDAFDATTRGEMAVAVTNVVEREGLPSVVGLAESVMAACATPRGKAEGRWQLGSSLTGRLACYPKDGQAWLLWTYEGEDIMARAVRVDGDAGRLRDWWNSRAADYLR